MAESEKPKKNKNKRDDKAQRILTAALELFEAKGYDGVAVPEIAAAAGIATGSIYRYFKDKEALGNALYRHWRRSCHALVLAAAPARLPAHALFTRYWHRLTLFARTNPKAMRFLELHHHGRWLDDESKAADNAFFGALEIFFAQTSVEGTMRTLPSGMATALVWGAAAGLAKFAGEGRLTGDAATAAEMGEALWRAIAPA